MEVDYTKCDQISDHVYHNAQRTLLTVQRKKRYYTVKQTITKMKIHLTE